MRFIIISGQSGAGKSVALHALEDLGFYGVDNLPVRLLPALVEDLSLDRDHPIDQIAAVVDVRSPHHDLDEFESILDRIRAVGVDVQVLFLEADRDILLKRFSETRRRHPLTDGEISLSEALDRESRMLEPLRQNSMILIDSSRTHLHQLRTIVQERIGRGASGSLSLLLQSFGFKHGTPRDADMVFDVRCLPNPYWESGLRGLTGRDQDVVNFLQLSPEVHAMNKNLRDFLERWIPSFARENRAYLSIAIGCTGGHHRSVYIIERLAEYFTTRYSNLIVRHRELDD
jgi:UPF0042 nucleotide-binding protein